MFKLLSILAVLSLLSLSSTEPRRRPKRQGGKLHITVLYESLCPDSRNFMPDLEEVYDELGDYLDVELVPFGKSSSDANGAIFRCQHGPRECEGNRLQSCVLSTTKNQGAQVKFVGCQMFAANHANADKCANGAGLFTNVDHCMSTALGTKLQLRAEQITKRYSPSFVPTIVYNHVFNQQLQDNSVRDFRSTVCYMLRKQIALPDSVCQ